MRISHICRLMTSMSCPIECNATVCANLNSVLSRIEQAGNALVLYVDLLFNETFQTS